MEFKYVMLGVAGVVSIIDTALIFVTMRGDILVLGLKLHDGEGPAITSVMTWVFAAIVWTVFDNRAQWWLTSSRSANPSNKIGIFDMATTWLPVIALVGGYLSSSGTAEWWHWTQLVFASIFICGLFGDVVSTTRYWFPKWIH